MSSRNLTKAAIELFDDVQAASSRLDQGSLGTVLGVASSLGALAVTGSLLWAGSIGALGIAIARGIVWWSQLGERREKALFAKHRDIDSALVALHESNMSPAAKAAREATYLEWGNGVLPDPGQRVAAPPSPKMIGQEEPTPMFGAAIGHDGANGQQVSVQRRQSPRQESDY